MQRRYQKISENSGVDDNGWMSLSASYNDHFYRSVQEEEICTVMNPRLPRSASLPCPEGEIK